jgi:hypothetical protein
MRLHLHVVGARNPGDVDAKQGPQLAQGAVKPGLIGRPIAGSGRLILLQKHAAGSVHGLQPFLQDGVGHKTVEIAPELTAQMRDRLRHEGKDAHVRGIPRGMRWAVGSFIGVPGTQSCVLKIRIFLPFPWDVIVL